MTTRRRQHLIVGAALALGLALRLGQCFFGVPLDEVIWSDMNNYVQAARQIGDHSWRETHFFQSIGFPVVILLLMKHSPDWTLGLSLLNCGASFVTLLFIWKAAEESFGFRTGIVTLIIASVHLPWIYLTTYALPETLFTLLLSACAWMAVRMVGPGSIPIVLSFLWGMCFILAFSLKSTHALWGPLFLAGLLLHRRRESLVPILALGIPIAAGLALYGALTYVKIGRVQLGPSSSGLNFVEGKCPDKKNADPTGASWYSPLYTQLGLNTTKYWDRPFTHTSYFWRQGLNCIKRDPFVLLQSLEAIPYLFFGNTTWPLNQRLDAARIRLYELYFAVFLVGGLMAYARGTIQRFNPAEFVIWSLPVLALFLTSYIFKSEIRYRLPFDVWLIPLSVLGWTSLINASEPQLQGHLDDTWRPRAGDASETP